MNRNETDSEQGWQKLDEAGAEIAELHAQITDIERRLAELDRAATSPVTVRREVLYEVWQNLMNAGDTKGALVVIKMIRKTNEVN